MVIRHWLYARNQQLESIVRSSRDALATSKNLLLFLIPWSAVPRVTHRPSLPRLHLTGLI